MKTFNYFVGIFVLFCAFRASGQITGVVSMSECDREANNLKLHSYKASAFDGYGNLVATSSVDFLGHFHLEVPVGRPVRLQFSGIEEGVFVASGHSSVQFVTAPSEISLKLFGPATYTGSNPRAAQVIYAQGSLKNDSTAVIASVVSYSALAQDSIQHVKLAQAGQTGSVWGLAYDRAAKRLFSSALAKRHSDLGGLGTGGIYVTDVVSNQTSPFINLDALGFKTGPASFKRELSTEWGVADHDSLMFSQVGKIGLGGLDISDDSRFLYTVNLYDRHLYRIKLHRDGVLPVATDVSRYELPLKAYTGGNARPFAVKYHNGQVYVGVVCDAQLSQKSQDLFAYIYSIDADDSAPGKEEFREVGRMPLNYPRGVVEYGVKGWYPWTDNYLQALVPGHIGWMIYPQPVLADIEFDEDGSMILSMMDRLGHQTGDGHLYRPGAGKSFQGYRGVSGGDILRLSKHKKKYEAEQNGTAGARTSEGHDNGEGPGGGEFYVNDGFSHSGTNWHHETATGGLALLSNNKRLLVSVREPDEYTTGGVKWFSNETGAPTNALAIFPGGMRPGYFWKANNVGDIELITPLPPTEIGDRVWLDNDGDGLQGADEPPLAGIELELYRNNQLIGKTQSDERGHYSFNNENVPESIKSRTDYEVRINQKQPIGVLTPTVARQGNAPELDSDAFIQKGDYASVALETTNPGENIHHIDFGFQCNDKPRTTASIECANNLLRIRLNGHNETQRYDLVPSARYEGIAIYSSASSIDREGFITEAALIAEKPYEATLRVYAPSGCYQDHFITSAGRQGCDFIPEDKELDKPFSLSVYPNPSTGPIHLTYRGNTSDAGIIVEVLNLDGSVLKRDAAKLGNGYHRQELNLSDQASGTYLLVVKEGTRQTTKNIVKN